MIEKHKDKQKYNNFGYHSTKFWLEGNDNVLYLSAIPHSKLFLQGSNSVPHASTLPERDKWRSRPLGYWTRINNQKFVLQWTFTFDKPFEKTSDIFCSLDIM